MKNALSVSCFDSPPVFRFVHGWGYTQKFWASIAKHMPDLDVSVDERGYFGARTHIYTHINSLYSVNTPSGNELTPKKNSFLVTHSLGTLLALQNLPESPAQHGIKGLIVINGFTAFSSFAGREVLDRMKQGLLEKPEAQMRAFWKSCGYVPDESPEHYDIPRLLEGLEQLGNLDMRARLEAIDCPVLVLAGGQDRICGIDIMKRHWDGHEIEALPEGGHALPHTHPQWCWTMMQEWIKRHYG